MDYPLAETVLETRKGLATADNARFVRAWQEVDFSKASIHSQSREAAKASRARWFPFAKGGDYRKWAGNQGHFVDWQDDGYVLQTTKHPVDDRVRATNFNLDYIFGQGLTWTFITSSSNSFRFQPPGGIFSNASGFCKIHAGYSIFGLLGLFNSSACELVLKLLNPTLNLTPGNVDTVPIPVAEVERAAPAVARLVELSTLDWTSFETSWEFQRHPLLPTTQKPTVTIESSYDFWIEGNRKLIEEVSHLEKENNRIFIDAYGLEKELLADVPISQITLTINPAYRYGSKATSDELWCRFRQHTLEELISYAIGCMMGRYSLDEPGLIYAHAGNVGFEPGRYATFPADVDGIVPITDELWFTDDGPSRIREFLRAVWGPDTLEENMAWLAESLGTKAAETPDEAIRRYIADKFFKDHLQTYKKRPIYWLFSSGKQGAFQALVYLHRYHEGTLARLRAEYVVPLTGKIQSRIEMMQKDAAAATSTAARNKLAKEVEKLKKKHLELLAYDEQLRHYADMRITLDLDDGVKVNYGKFGDLLAEVKAITGGASDD